MNLWYTLKSRPDSLHGMCESVNEIHNSYEGYMENYTTEGFLQVIQNIPKQWEPKEQYNTMVRWKVTLIPCL